MASAITQPTSWRFPALHWPISTPPLLQGWQWVVVVYVASRLIIFSVIALARMVFVPGEVWHPGGVMSVLLQWDAELWYVAIARYGYTYSPDFPSSMGFFPFYPMLIKGMSYIFRDMRVAALVVSHLCFLAAALLLNALIRIDYKDERVSRAALTFLMFSPVSFFFSNAYTESTFLMLSVGAFVAALKRQWLIACLCGGCLSATRNVGMFIAVPLFIEYVRQTWDPTKPLWGMLNPRILLFALIPMGFGLFSLYGYVKFGDPFAYLTATRVWGRQFVMPWVTLGNVRVLDRFYHWLFLGTLSIGITLYLSGFLFRIRATYLVYGAMLIGIYLCGQSLEAIPRYLSVVFPIFIVLGLIANRYRWSYLPLLAGSTALLTLCTILSAMGYWMT